MRASSLLFTIALAVGWEAPLLAQGRAESASPAAEELFRQGRAAIETGDFVKACDRFAASEKLEPAPGTLLNIADCEVHLGALLSAAEHFKLAASGFPKNDPRRAYVAGRVNEIDHRLAHVTVHVAARLPNDAHVTRDGQTFDLRLIDNLLAANPRATTFVVTARGFVDRTFTLPLADGQSAEITLDIGDPTPAPQVTPGESPAESPTVHASAPPPWRTVGFATGGVGLASLAMGGITGALALHEASVVKKDCSIPAYTCSAPGVSAGSTGQTFATTSTIAFIAGAALTATGLVLVFVVGKPRTEQAPVVVAPQAGTVGLAPYLGVSGGGAVTTLSF
jgi:hypothetical protein